MLSNQRPLVKLGAALLAPAFYVALATYGQLFQHPAIAVICTLAACAVEARVLAWIFE